MVLAALDSASFGFGVAAGAIAITATFWFFDARGWLHEPSEGVNWMGMFGAVGAGIAPALGIVAALIVWLAS